MEVRKTGHFEKSEVESWPWREVNQEEEKENKKEDWKINEDRRCEKIKESERL